VPRSLASPRLGQGRDVTSGAVGQTDGRVVDDSLMVNVTVGCQWALNRDSYQ
jgi:hypothetical protein